MIPLQNGKWGMPADRLELLPGYAGELDARQAEARAIMERAG